MKDFFKDLSDPVERCLAEVSHYIGDEAVISWTVKRGTQDGNCIRLFFEFQMQISKHEKRYRDNYGFVPEFKAALHVGEVVTTEVGEMKSEIVFHGDVLNTTARIEALCVEMGSDLLISDELKNAVSLSQYQITDFGLQSLKGKKQEVRVWGVTTGERERSQQLH